VAFIGAASRPGATVTQVVAMVPPIELLGAKREANVYCVGLFQHSRDCPPGRLCQNSAECARRYQKFNPAGQPDIGGRSAAIGDANVGRRQQRQSVLGGAKRNRCPRRTLVRPDPPAKPHQPAGSFIDNRRRGKIPCLIPRRIVIRPAAAWRLGFGHEGENDCDS
jgi:hypothetical protein